MCGLRRGICPQIQPGEILPRLRRPHEETQSRQEKAETKAEMSRFRAFQTLSLIHIFAFCLDPETGFEWIGEYDITADELLSGAGGNNATKTEQAEKLILELLANGKELASEDIEKAAVDAGISARTVRAAKKNLDGRITSKRIGAAWYHALKK